MSARLATDRHTLAPSAPGSGGERRAAGGIDADGLVKRWRGQPRPVLDGLDLHVGPGEAHWIGGRNGAGKTTLLRVVGGLLVPEAGAVRILGRDVAAERRAVQSSLGHLSAVSAGLYNRLTVRQHLRLWCGTALVPRAARAAATEGTIERFALAELADRRCDRMSMGQRQRVRLASAFLHDPACVLLDEPANSLDDEGLALLHAELDRVRDRGGSVVWAGPSGEATTFAFDARHDLRDGRLERR